MPCVNDKAAAYYRDHGVRTAPPALSDDDLARIRQRRAELFARWDAVRPGEALELLFPPEPLEPSQHGMAAGRVGPRAMGRNR